MTTNLYIGKKRPANHAGRLFRAGIASLLLHLLILVWLTAPPGNFGAGSFAPDPNPLRAVIVEMRSIAAEPLSDGFKELEAPPAVVASATSSPPPPSSNPISLPYYYRRSELTTPPRIVDEPDLDDPLRFPTAHSGQTELHVFINENGMVDQVAVLSGTLPEAWANAAAEAFKHARFEPGRLGYVAVRSQIKIIVGVGSLDQPNLATP